MVRALLLVLIVLVVSAAGLRVPPPSMMGRAEKRAAAKSAKKKGGARGSAASIRKNVLPRNVQPADAPRADGGEWLKPKPAAPEPATRRVDVDLGRGKAVVVMLPVLEGEVDGAALESISVEDVVEQYGHLTGAGDVVWPAGLAFSRLLVHCPSFVQGKRVLELGAGLGAVGLSAATAGAASVLLTDYDADVLGFARQAAAENGVSERVTTAQFDWSAEEGVPEGAPFELVLGADVLYDKDNARHIARLLPRLLADGGRCLISDQTQWPWRADFSVACAAVGLVVDDATLPAPEDVRLLSITRAEDQEA